MAVRADKPTSKLARRATPVPLFTYPGNSSRFISVLDNLNLKNFAPGFIPDNQPDQRLL